LYSRVLSLSTSAAARKNSRNPKTEPTQVRLGPGRSDPTSRERGNVVSSYFVSEPSGSLWLPVGH